MSASSLIQRHRVGSHETQSSEFKDPVQNPNRWTQLSQGIQNICYQVFAYTIWDRVVSGFKPGREIAIDLMDIQPDDRILLVGEGSGLDFECLPEKMNKLALKAFDFSPEMVRQSKLKARQYGIPETNCFVGDAQDLPFTHEKFDKIYFPLSIASIPNPTLALREAERVLAPDGKIILFDKLRDDDVPLSWKRSILNIVTRCLFADINRNLGSIIAPIPNLKMVHYESLKGKLDGIFAKYLGQYYRVAVVVKRSDYLDRPEVPSKLQ